MLPFILARFFSPRTPPGPTTREALEALDDEALMERYAQGEALAFEPLMARYERRILTFIYRSVGDFARAEEITQDVFMRVIQGASRYKQTARFSTWIFTIARNACVDESRRRRHRRAASLDAPVRPGEAGSPALVDQVADNRAVSGTGEMTRKEFAARLEVALAELPEEQRDVFVLRHYADMRFVDIGRMYGISENTVKSRMRYALQALRAALADFDGFSFDGTDAAEVGER